MQNLTDTETALICAALQHYANHCDSEAIRLVNRNGGEFERCADRGRALRNRLLNNDAFWPEADAE